MAIRRAIGRKLSLNGYPFTVIGVAPRGFTGADVAFKPDFFIPIMMRSEVKHIAFASWNDRHNWWLAASGPAEAGASASSKRKASCSPSAKIKNRQSAGVCKSETGPIPRIGLFLRRRRADFLILPISSRSRF